MYLKSSLNSGFLCLNFSGFGVKKFGEYVFIHLIILILKKYDFIFLIIDLKLLGENSMHYLMILL